MVSQQRVLDYLVALDKQEQLERVLQAATMACLRHKDVIATIHKELGECVGRNIPAKAFFLTGRVVIVRWHKEAASTIEVLKVD